MTYSVKNVMFTDNVRNGPFSTGEISFFHPSNSTLSVPEYVDILPGEQLFVCHPSPKLNY